MLAKKKREKESSTTVNILNTPFLVIVESPSKCAKIEQHLGFQYKCIASKGHIRELKKVECKTNSYEPKYEIIDDKKAHVVWMKTIVKSFSPANIFIGTDDDREGEGIAWHICQVCDLDTTTTKRILFREVTQSALIRSVATPGLLRMHIVRAQQARQILDQMIGFQISPILSRLVQHETAVFLSAGRCQTPTLRLVYDRHIENVDKQENIRYKIQGCFLDKVATLNKEYENETECLSFLEKSKTFAHVLQMKPPKEKALAAPSPFNTASLLQFASNALHMSPKSIMDCCQSLYQEGFITYMRTESKLYSNVFLSQIETFIDEEFGKEYNGMTTDLENAESSNPHEAIRVTNLHLRIIDHTDRKLADLYKIIWNRTVQSCMSQYKQNDTDIAISAPEDSHYKSIIEIPVFLGWKSVSLTMKEMNKLREINTSCAQYMGAFDHKQIGFSKIECTLHMRDIDKYYTEASLIQKLEHLGIGRPSTYSMMVEAIQERKYIKKENIEGKTITQTEFKMTKDNLIKTTSVTKTFGAYKNKMKIQPLGIQTIELLSAHFNELFDYNYTSEMESDLDKIKDSWENVLKKCDNTIRLCISPLKRQMNKAYRIDDVHELVHGKSGAMIRIKGDKNNVYKPLKGGLELDFDKLERDEYKLSDLLEVDLPCLGILHGEEVYVRNGPHGAYVRWGGKTASIKYLTGNVYSMDKITLEMVKVIIDKKEMTQKEDAKLVLRELDENTSVRKSKFGNYIYVKTEKMKKPKFVNIKNCPYEVLEEGKDIVLGWVKMQLRPAK
jgi:DNA topoisomerase-1